MTELEQLSTIASILGKGKKTRVKRKSVKRTGGTKNRRLDEVTLKSKFLGKRVEGVKLEFNYSVEITTTGFKTRAGEEFELLQQAVNQDILTNGLPESYLPGVTVWTQGFINNLSLVELF